MRDSGNIVKWAFAHLQNAQKTDQKRHIEHMSDAEKKASITPRQSTTLSSKVPITPRTSDAVSGGSVKVSTVASASSSKSSSTVTALMENKMSKMKEHLMKQKAKQDEQREKQFSEAMQQSGKLFM